MKKILFSFVILFSLAACSKNKNYSPDFKTQLRVAADTLSPSEYFYLNTPLEISGLGVLFGDYNPNNNATYFLPAIKKLTNIDINIEWASEFNFANIVGATLLNGSENLPDLITPNNFGIMDLAEDKFIIPLEDYFDLMPNILRELGSDGIERLRQKDGHVYCFPSIVKVPGAWTTMIRKDWLDNLGLKIPDSWEEWKFFWRAVRDHDLNGNGDSSDEIPLMLDQGPDNERSLAALLNAFGIRCSYDCQFYSDSDGKTHLIYEHPRYLEFLLEMRNLYDEKLLDNDFDTRNQAKLFNAMDSDICASTVTWAERTRISSNKLHANGNKKALWVSVQPIIGPHNNRLIQQRNTISPSWCITKAALQNGKAENIVKLFNWLYSDEGSYLYSFGIQGISWNLIEGSPVLNKDLIKNGFVDFRAAGIQMEPFGGLFQQNAFIQCLFTGQPLDKATPETIEFFRGLFEVNDDYFYIAPILQETSAYTNIRTTLIAQMCSKRNDFIKGKISLREFVNEYNSIKNNGLQKVIDELN